MQSYDIDDTTKSLVEADAKYGKFSSDPSDEFIQRYTPAKIELETLDLRLKDEIGQAINDDEPQRQKKLTLLDAYRALPVGKEQILTMPLVKRAVRRNVSYMKGKVLGESPLVTVKPTSNKTVMVLVEDPTYGTVPMPKTSEEVAQALEWWIDWKLRNRVGFLDVVEIAATEAKRGQTPTWLKITHKKEKRTIKSPRFEKKGPIAVTFESKDDVEVVSGDPDQIRNISTYNVLLPADEQDPQESRWLAESIPMTSEALRRALYNGDYPLIPKAEWEEFIATGAETEQPQHEKQIASSERRIATAPKGKHDVREVWLFHTVPMKETLAIVGDDGEQTTKTLKKFQEYSMVGHYHLKHGRMMSLIRNPRDDEQRPYVPVYDRKEPFRLTGESIAEDVLPYQRVQSQLISLEIRGKVVETTPVAFAEPGSAAGDWITEHEVDPGDVIPRLRPDEIEFTNLGKGNTSLLGLIQFNNGEYEKNTSLGDLQLGLNVQTHTTASAVSQVLNEGQTDSLDVVERFCRALAEAIVLYVKNVQQYMRTGEVIPFDPETVALITAGLDPEKDQMPDMAGGMPVRFPIGPVTDDFTFAMTAITGETQQADFEKFVAFKQIVDADGAQLAQIIGPLASGQLAQHPSIEQALIEHVTRSQRLMKKIGDAVAKDGKSYAISPQLIEAIAKEGQILAQQAAAAQQGAMNAQGVGGGGQPPGAQPDAAGMGANVPQSGGPPMPVGGEGPAGQAPEFATV